MSTKKQKEQPVSLTKEALQEKLQEELQKEYQAAVNKFQEGYQKLVQETGVQLNPVLIAKANSITCEFEVVAVPNEKK